MMQSLPLKKLHAYVLFSLLVFFGVQSLKFFSVVSPNWVLHHLNDFLVMPIVGVLGLHAVWFMKKDRTLRIDLFTIFSLVALFAFVFEYYLPRQSYRYTGDIWDVGCYIGGGLVFYLFQKAG